MRPIEKIYNCWIKAKISLEFIFDLWAQISKGALKKVMIPPTSEVVEDAKDSDTVAVKVDPMRIFQ